MLDKESRKTAEHSPSSPHEIIHRQPADTSHLPMSKRLRNDELEFVIPKISTDTMSDATSTVATPPEDTSRSTSQNGAKQPDMCNDASQPGSQRSSTDLIPIASSSDTVRRKSDRNRAKLHRNYADIHKRGLTGVACPNLAYNIALDKKSQNIPNTQNSRVSAIGATSI